jgi:hypothetical protein
MRVINSHAALYARGGASWQTRLVPYTGAIKWGCRLLTQALVPTRYHNLNNLRDDIKKPFVKRHHRARCTTDDGYIRSCGSYLRYFDPMIITDGLFVPADITKPNLIWIMQRQRAGDVTSTCAEDL